MQRHTFLATLAVLGAATALGALFASSAAASSPVGVASATAASPSGNAPIGTPAAPNGAFINRPTMPLAQYKAIKSSSPELGSKAASKASATPLSVRVRNGWNGITQASTGFFPSDSNGVVSKNGALLVTNSHLTIYNKSTGGQTSDRTLNALAGYSTEALFDPRIVYDSIWNRYVITADAFQESATVQYEVLMISKTGNPAGNYWVYRANTRGFCGGTSPFWDYPQVGQTQDAIVVTGNCFNSTGEQPDTFGIAKALLYNGLGFSVPVFGRAGEGTLTPANVVDNRPANFLVSTNQHMVGFQDPQAGGYASLSSDNSISGFQAFAVPRSAGQAGCTTTSCHLDTGDGRFVQDSTQFGDQLWNVATYGFAGANGSFATPYWGQFSIAGHNTTQKGAAFADACSDDFNASLATSTTGKMWLNYTSTDPQGSSCGQTFVRQMEAGRTSATAAGALDNIVNAFTSPAELTGDFDSNFGLQRWGDTSSVSILNDLEAYTVNNSVANANNWGTRWVHVTQ
jgi:hypothetical protein